LLAFNTWVIRGWPIGHVYTPLTADEPPRTPADIDPDDPYNMPFGHPELTKDGQQTFYFRWAGNFIKTILELDKVVLKEPETREVAGKLTVMGLVAVQRELGQGIHHRVPWTSNELRSELNDVESLDKEYGEGVNLAVADIRQAALLNASGQVERVKEQLWRSET